MADVELVATQDFSYSTRRLKAGDTFSVPAPMARVLIGIKKAEPPREVGKVPAPPKRIVVKAGQTTPTKAPEPVAAMSTETAEKPKRRRTRKSTAKK